MQTTPEGMRFGRHGETLLDLGLTADQLIRYSLLYRTLKAVLKAGRV